MKYFLAVFIILFIFSCEKKYAFWGISKFDINKTALTKGEEIKLFYTSSAPDENLKQEYYIHLIVISQKSRDTINILTPLKNFLNENSGDEIYNYYEENNLLGKITQSVLNGEEINHVNELSDSKHKKITKVARDKDFDYIADNNFPTVIGIIGKTNKN